MNHSLLKEAVAAFNKQLDEAMVFEAVKHSPKLLFAMMSRAREAGRADLADNISAAIVADEEKPAYKHFGAGQSSSRPETDQPAMGTCAVADVAARTARGADLHQKASAPSLCTFWVRPPMGGAQVPCGAPAKFRAADNGRLLYCAAHGEAVERIYKLVPLTTAGPEQQQRQPKISQHTLP